MTLKLPDYLLSALELNEQSTIEECASALEITSIFDNFSLSKEAKNAIVEIARGDLVPEIEVLNDVFSTTVKYTEIQFEDQVVAEVLVIPSGDPLENLPTSAERLLVYALCMKPELVDGSKVKDGLAIFRYLPEAASFNEYRNSIKTCSAPFAGFGLDKKYPPHQAIWEGHTKIFFKKGSKILAKEKNQKNLELLDIAIHETNIRWKYLGYYRIFEYGYLSAILNKINDNFLIDPSKAIDEAQESSKNELNQFIELVNLNGLTDFFETIADGVKDLKSNYNRFACALEDRFSNDVRAKGFTKAKKGVYFAYQIRCAIVHAGEKGLIFESYSDAVDAISDLIKPLEEAVLWHLGVMTA
jgi:hypothetical protein